MSINLKSLENLIPPLKEKHQAEELALQIETIVRQLNGLPPIESEKIKIIDLLKSSCLLLQRLQDNSDLLKTKETAIKPTIETSKIDKIPHPSSEENKPQIIREKTPEKPSATAEDLMRLRDWVLLANSKDSEENASPQVLDAIYKQLAKVLEKEGIKAIEETGTFNYERHQVISTQPTDDPQKDDLICEIIRPGYLFNDQLIRPEEVIVYQLTK